MTFPIIWTRASSVLAACAMGLLVGCTNMSGLDGRAEYACKAPQGVQCDSVSGNYYNALQNNLPSQRQRGATDGDTAQTASTRRQTPASDTRPARLLSIAQPASDNASPATGLAFPLRSQARVLRLWFKPWEDADRDLYDQGYVYVQIDSGRWLIDHAHERIRDAHAPIRPPRTAPASAASEQPSPTTAKPVEPSFMGRPAGSAPALSPSLAGTPDVPTIDLP